MFPLLSVIVFLPLLGAIVVLLLPGEQHGLIRGTALGFAILDFVFALVLMLLYSEANVSAALPITSNAANATFQFTELLTWIPAIGINFSLGVDGISLLLVVLTSLLTAVCVAASYRIEQKVKNYMAFMLLLECGILGVFLSTNLFLFYIFWELMLIPAYLLVGTWGGERRIYAAFKFVLYTSVGSLLMLAGIIALGYFHQQAAGGSYTLDLASLLSTKLDNTTQTWLFLAFAAAFAVKVPLVPFHSWLPDTYAEAPAPVTALLAGAMSKTGAYGFLRFCVTLFPAAAHTLAPLFSILAIISILYCALMALVQNDLKRLLGYSSISHLGLIVLATFAFNVQGIEGAVLQMVNHGITTAALFLILGFIEARTGTRRLSDYGGLAVRIPVLATVLMIATLSSLGLPGLNSFAGEFLAMLGIFQHSAVYGVLATAVIVPAAWYLIRFFLGMMEGRRVTEGPVASLERKGRLVDISYGEFLTVLPLLALIFYIGVQPAPFTFLMEPSVVNTLQVIGTALIH
ncbi:MAG TPA: NADH-quinone oxidoreductase subunit M [Ktedonobacteraceae bacterium]|nr:NADH-quinone oxidoreductase subunit M [Ktedonobacteraceae bacterium]